MSAVSLLPPRWTGPTSTLARVGAEFAVLTARICVKPIQCYSLAAMAELQQVFNDITANPGLVKHFVMASGTPGVFNFGGDLSLFVLLVRARDLDSSSCTPGDVSTSYGGWRTQLRSACTPLRWCRGMHWEGGLNRRCYITT